MPFDRHDWFVDRCGEEVRYVIDFYFDDDKAGSPEVGHCHHKLGLKRTKKKKKKNTPFGVSLMRSQVLYQAAQG